MALSISTSWIPVWFVLSSFLIFYDFAYLFFRPRTFPGGDLFQYFEPYADYAKVDNSYSPSNFGKHDGWVTAAAIVNIPEVLLQYWYIYLKSVGAQWADLVGFTSAVSTLMKTLLFFLSFACEGFRELDYKTDFDKFMKFWLIPNLCWLIFPLLIILILGSRIARRLQKSVKTKEY